MKKIALYILAAAAILAGCSKKNIETTPVNSEDAWMYDATLPVPVRFTAGGNMQTKSGVIDSAADMVGKEFGFFAVNLKTWSKDSTIALLGGMPQNVLANARLDGDHVKFDMEGGPYFYSQTDHTPFTFYGYHARVSKSETWLLEEKIRVVVNFGYDDVLYAKAEAETMDGYEGFNARYIRKFPDKQPHMMFEHKTACLSFKAKANKDLSKAELDDSEKVIIDSVEILDTYTKANLIIAHKSDPEQEGTFQDPTKSGTAGLPVKNADGSTNLSVELAYQQSLTDTNMYTPLPVALGEPMFIHPDDKIQVKIYYRIESRNSVLGNIPTLQPVIYTLEAPATKTDEGEVNGFIEGYRYNYTLVVHSPEKVVIEAEVVPYKSAFGDDVWQDVQPDYETAG